MAKISSTQLKNAPLVKATKMNIMQRVVQTCTKLNKGQSVTEKNLLILFTLPTTAEQSITRKTEGPRAYACYMGSSARAVWPTFLPSQLQNLLTYERDHPFKTSAFFRGGRGQSTVDEFRQWNFMILHSAQVRFLAKNQLQSNEITKFWVSIK